MKDNTSPEAAPGFWRALTWELRFRLVAVIALGVLAFTGHVDIDLSTPDPSFLDKIGLILLIYVVATEIIGLILANIIALDSFSLLARSFTYGILNSRLFRWLTGLGIAGAIVWKFFAT